VSELFVTNKLRTHTFYPHVIYILKFQATANASVPNAFALTVYCQFTLWRKFWIEHRKISL